MKTLIIICMVLSFLDWNLTINDEPIEHFSQIIRLIFIVTAIILFCTNY